MNRSWTSSRPLSALDAWQAFAVESTLRATLAHGRRGARGLGPVASSASVRHLAWASALTGSLAIPVLMLVLPSWRVPILPRGQGQAAPVDLESRAVGPSRSSRRSCPRPSRAGHRR